MLDLLIWRHSCNIQFILTRNHITPKFDEIGWIERVFCNYVIILNLLTISLFSNMLEGTTFKSLTFIRIGIIWSISSSSLLMCYLSQFQTCFYFLFSARTKKSLRYVWCKMVLGLRMITSLSRITYGVGIYSQT